MLAAKERGRGGEGATMILPDNEEEYNGVDYGALDAIVVVKYPQNYSIVKETANTRADAKSKTGNTTRGAGSRSSLPRSCQCVLVHDRVRRRHNATQTPDSISSCSRTQRCQKHSSCCCALANGDLSTLEMASHCHITHHCHHYTSPGGTSGKGGAGSGGGDGNSNKRKTCNRHRHHCRSVYHHGHQQNCNLTKGQHNHHHHHQHPHNQIELQAAIAERQLPFYSNSKSSYDSSDDMQQQDEQQQQEHLQEIAIEIDANTMTEDNTSTATSNFAYKMATGNSNIAPIIMAPLQIDDCNCKCGQNDGRKQRRQRQHHRACQRFNSMNSISSNCAVEACSPHGCKCGERNEGDGETNRSLADGQCNNAHHTHWGSRDINDLYTTNKRTEDRGSKTTDAKRHNENDNGIISSSQLVCCNDSTCCCGTTNGGQKLSGAAHNECVKIQRKLFRASAGTDDCCSTCSHCTNCSCRNGDATSCSSFDDLDVDDGYELQGRRQMESHELVVTADCHRCNMQRQSTSSTCEEEEEEEGELVECKEKVLRLEGNEGERGYNKAKAKRSFHEHNNTTTDDSSAPQSVRSSGSYCSCHSSTCYCCECNCVADDGDGDCDTTTTGQMLTARDTSFTPLTSAAAAEFDAEHSSTLTPLTNASSSVASTPAADDADVTLRSFSNTLTEDVGGSSLSQSAEYFSISSSNPQSKLSAADTPKRRAEAKHTPRTLLESNAADDEECEKQAEERSTRRKPCKHYIKHHRHKRATSPTDGYL